GGEQGGHRRWTTGRPVRLHDHPLLPQVQVRTARPIIPSLRWGRPASGHQEKDGCSDELAEAAGPPWGNGRRRGPTGLGPHPAAGWTSLRGDCGPVPGRSCPYRPSPYFRGCRPPSEAPVMQALRRCGPLGDRPLLWLRCPLSPPAPAEVPAGPLHAREEGAEPEELLQPGGRRLQPEPTGEGCQPGQAHGGWVCQEPPWGTRRQLEDHPAEGREGRRGWDGKAGL